MPVEAQQKNSENAEPAWKKNLKPWKPGQSGNPKGKPPGPDYRRMFDKILQRAAPGDPKGRSYVELAMELLVNQALKRKDAKTIASLMKWISEPADWRAKAKINAEKNLRAAVKRARLEIFSGLTPIIMEFVPDDKIADLVQRIDEYAEEMDRLDESRDWSEYR